MDAADVESAEEIKVGNTGRIDSFYICGQRRFSAGRLFLSFFGFYRNYLVKRRLGR